MSDEYIERMLSVINSKKRNKTTAAQVESALDYANNIDGVVRRIRDSQFKTLRYYHDSKSFRARIMNSEYRFVWVDVDSAEIYRLIDLVLADIRKSGNIYLKLSAVGEIENGPALATHAKEFAKAAKKQKHDIYRKLTVALDIRTQKLR